MSKLNNIVIKGELIGTELLQSDSYRAYRSIIRKSENIKNHLEIINEVYDNIITSLPDDSASEKNRLVYSIHDYCENIYTCMEYILQVLRSEYRVIYRQGTLIDSFNKTLNDIKKNPSKPIYSNNIVLTTYILNSQIWYDVIHDIRTEETHNGMGEVEVDLEEKKLFYVNTLRRSSDGSKNVKIDIKNFNDIYIQFCMYVNELDNLLKNLIS